jgi:osmotically-inducible protein OsmY
MRRAAILLLAAAAGCATGRGLVEKFDDSWLATKARLHLATYHEADRRSRVDVEVAGGVVTLTGVVVSEDERAEAERIVRNVVGVADVANRIEVDPFLEPPRRPPTAY